MAGIRGFTPSDDVRDALDSWWNTPIKNRYNILPLAEDARTGENVWAVPGLLAEPFESLKRVIANGGRNNTYLIDDAGVPVKGRGTIENLDGLNVAGIAPLGTMALGTAAGAIERGAIGAGPTKAIGPRPEPGAFIPDTGASGASRVLAETPYGIKRTEIEQAANAAYARQLEDGKFNYFEPEYDDLGNLIVPDEYTSASPWGRRAFDYIEPTAEAVAAAARAAGHDLDLTNFNSASRYGTMKTRGGNEYKVRVSDHGNTSSLHDAPDYNIAPGVMNPEDFVSEMMKLYSNSKDAAIPGLLANALEKPKGFTAYHGSPHDFDKFDLSKIGTGEGAQAYGHGLYFAENEGVARSYRDQLGGRDVKAYGEQVPFRLGSIPEDTLSMELHRTGDIDSAIAALESAKKEYGFIPPEEFDAVIARAQQMKADRAVESSHKGRMYEVRINADPEQFLNYDLPVSQQPKHIQDAVARLPISKDKWPYNYFKDGVPDEMAMVSEYLKTPDQTKILKEAGIPGVSYLDAGSRVRGDGSRNYVLFDDSLVDILRKYSNAPTGAAAPLAISGQGQDTFDANALLRAYGIL